MTYFKNFIDDEEGQDLVEYALLLGFVAVTGVALLASFNTSLTAMFTKISGKLATASS